MCLAIPLRITSILGNEALAEIEGISRKIRIDFVNEVVPGDYVMVHAGFALEKLTEQQVKENLELIQEVTNAAIGNV